MPSSSAPPANVSEKLRRLQELTGCMPALEDELEFLEMRLAQGDRKAAHLGLRTTAESLLHHVAAVTEGLELEGPKSLHDLENVLKKRAAKLSDRFWVHVRHVRDLSNPHCHGQAEDVYRASTLRPAHDPWKDVEDCIDSLIEIVLEFRHRWPPPQETPKGPPDVAAAESSNHQGADTVAGPKSPTAPAQTAVPADVIVFIANMSVSQALADHEARQALQLLTRLTAGGVTRRLNAAHGRTKVRNVFPETFSAAIESTRAPVAPEPDDEEESPFNYEAIGNLTVSQAREYGMAESIARLTGMTELAVKRKLGQLNGNGVVRRQFSWYEATTIGELTARTAVMYQMAPLLARALRKRRSTVIEKLRSVPGQTKLRTLFPELES